MAKSNNTSYPSPMYGFGLKSSPFQAMKGSKKPKVAGGDFYGSGIRNPQAKSRSSYLDPSISKDDLSTPPRKLA